MNARPPTVTISVLLPDLVTRLPEYRRLSEERNPVRKSPQQIFAILYVAGLTDVGDLQGTLSAPPRCSNISCIPR
jgi:hypothetical protein